jgi:hypothetical protein
VTGAPSLPSVSYDLYMLKPQPGEDPMDTLERLEEQGEPASADPAAAERNRRIADALLALNPAYGESAIELRDIELTAEGGLQLTLSDDQASMNIPYWDSLDPAHLAREIDAAAKAIAAETDWQLYDPQLEKFLDPARDADEFVAAFGVGVGHVQRIAAEHEAEPPSGECPSVWRRLFGRD